MRLHIGKAFNSLKLTDYLEEEEIISVEVKVTLFTLYSIGVISLTGVSRSRSRSNLHIQT